MEVGKIFSRAIGSLVSNGANKTDSSSTDTTAETTTTPSTTATSADFSTFLKANLKASSDGTVSEEDLFAGIVRHGMQKLKGEEGLKKFDETLASTKKEYPRSIEEATKFALMTLQQSNYITYEEGHKINAESFEAAQLDSNTEALYDGTGGANDPTKAVEEMEKAITLAQAKIDGFVGGSSKALERPVAVFNTGIENVPTRIGSLASSVTKSGSISTSATGTPVGGAITPNGTKVDGAGGFLFKPVSENESKLIVLSPDLVGPLVSGVKLLRKDGSTLEEGKFKSINPEENNRAKFTFNKPGKSYEKDITVQITYIDGTIGTYSIPDPSKRYD